MKIIKGKTTQAGSVSKKLIIALLASIVILLVVIVVQRKPPLVQPPAPLPDPSKMLAPLVQSLGQQRKDDVNQFVDAIRQVAIMNSNNFVAVSNKWQRAADAAKKGFEDKMRQQAEETERLRTIIEGMTNRETVVQQPVSPDPSSGNPSSGTADGKPSESTDDQSQQERQQIGLMVGAAVCIAQPELCAIAPFFGELFGLFGGDAGKEVLRAVESVSKGNTPTEDQLKKLKDIASRGIPPGAIGPLTEILRKAQNQKLSGAEAVAKALGLDQLDGTIKAILDRLQDSTITLSQDQLQELAIKLLARPNGPGYATETQKTVLLSFLNSIPALQKYAGYFKALPVQ